MPADPHFMVSNALKQGRLFVFLTVCFNHFLY